MIVSKVTYFDNGQSDLFDNEQGDLFYPRANNYGKLRSPKLTLLTSRERICGK